MRIIGPFLVVLALFLAAIYGVQALGLSLFFGAIIPYAAAAIFLVGFVAKVIGWARSPVPFPIATTCGQQKSLPWIKQAKIENPSTTTGVLIRMALEVFAFRSLFRNTKTQLVDGKLSYASNKWLWAMGLAFHYSMLVVLIRHMRFFMEPIPAFVTTVTFADGFMLSGPVAVPSILATTLVFIGAVSFLLVRRLVAPQIRYFTLANDYFPLFLLLGIGLSGAWLRHIEKIDVPSVKAMVMGLLHLSPAAAQGIGPIFYGHLFLVSVLLAYFPFSKLMHMAGVFMSPTRNLRANSREYLHVNPWNQPVSVHTYEEYEDEFRDRMRDAGLPLEKEA